jgi:hypothetical protein
LPERHIKPTKSFDQAGNIRSRRRPASELAGAAPKGAVDNKIFRPKNQGKNGPSGNNFRTNFPDLKPEPKSSEKKPEKKLDAAGKTRYKMLRPEVMSAGRRRAAFRLN